MIVDARWWPVGEERLLTVHTHIGEYSKSLKQRTVVKGSWQKLFGELLEKLSMTEATIIKVEIS